MTQMPLPFPSPPPPPPPPPPPQLEKEGKTLNGVLIHPPDDPMESIGYKEDS